MHSSKKTRTIISLFLAVFICSCSSDGHGDTTPPTVVSSTPAAGANNIGVNSSIAAVFSEPMDSSSISTSTISVNKAGSNIAGTVTYAGNTATFTPSNPLMFNSAYSVSISGNVKDASGNNMSTNYTLSFTTVSYPSNHPVAWESGQLNSGEYYTLEDINADGISDLSIHQSGTVTYSSGKDFSQLWQFTSGDGHSISVILAKTAIGKRTPVDLDGDGQKEILVSDNYTDTGTGCSSATLYIYDAMTHALKWQTTYTYIPPAGSTGSGSYDAKIGDLDGDGVYEIIITQQASYKPAGAVGSTADSWVKVLKGPNHSVVWDSGALAKFIVMANAYYDINLDGINDLTIAKMGAGSSVMFYNGTDFSQLWQSNSDSIVSRTLAVAETDIGKLTPVDLDGDGQKELLVIDSYYDFVTKTYIGFLYIYDALTHTLKWQNSYTYTTPTGIYGNIRYGAAVRDIDGDGVYEIILTQYVSYANGATTSTYDNWVKVLKGPNHAVAWDSGPINQDMDRFSRVVADINLDGINDLIIRKKGTNPSVTFYRGSDFSQLWQFTSSADHDISEIMAETSIGKDTPVDLDGDGQKEVLILDTYNNTSSGNAGATLYIYDAATHALKWQTTYTYALPAGSSGYVSYRADVEDINGDAVYEIMLSQNASYMPAGASSYTYDNWVKVLK